jgi:pimeloyl-ACP methyl ester carboxylesterase
MLLVGAMVALSAGAVAGTARGAGTGPALTEPALAASLVCSPDVAVGAHDPVLLVHGTASGPNEFTWNWIPALAANHVPYCTVEMPKKALADIQASAEYVVYAIRTMHASSGRTVDIVGHSQGGMIPRWALKYWPDTRAMVDDVVGIAASNHGTPVADAACSVPCAPGEWQQRSSAAFITALNSGAETWAGISYTDIYTHTDEIVMPNLDAGGSTSLHTGAGAIANIAIQDLCPLALTEHIGLGTYDPVAYAIALDALDHPGPADAARVPTSVCTQLLMPGVDPSTFATDYAATIADLGVNIAAGERVAAEPPLRCYVDASCPAVAALPTAPTPASAERRPAPARVEVKGATLAATGVDLDTRAVVSAPMLAIALAGGALRRRVST